MRLEYIMCTSVFLRDPRWLSAPYTLSYSSELLNGHELKLMLVLAMVLIAIYVFLLLRGGPPQACGKGCPNSEVDEGESQRALCRESSRCVSFLKYNLKKKNNSLSKAQPKTFLCCLMVVHKFKCVFIFACFLHLSQFLMCSVSQPFLLSKLS